MRLLQRCYRIALDALYAFPNTSFAKVVITVAPSPRNELPCIIASVVGSLRARFVEGRSPWAMGLEMVAVAGLAALAALGIGSAAQAIGG